MNIDGWGLEHHVLGSKDMLFEEIHKSPGGDCNRSDGEMALCVGMIFKE